VKRRGQPDIEAAFDLTGCELNVWVKVEKNWMKNFFLLRQLGYFRY
jgi:GTPase Era involved in 16S rRNA processing